VRHSIQLVEGVRAIWLTGPIELDIVGERFYMTHLKAVAGAELQTLKDRKLRNDDIEYAGLWPQRVAWLVPEHDNPHDRNAVMVWICGGTAGHLSRAYAACWQPMLLRLSAHYRAPVACLARVKGKRTIYVTLQVPTDAPSPESEDFYL